MEIIFGLLLGVIVALALLSFKSRRAPPQRRDTQPRPVKKPTIEPGRALPIGFGGKGASPTPTNAIAQSPPWAGVDSYLSVAVKRWEKEDREYRRKRGLKEDGSDDPRFAGPPAGETTPKNWPSAERYRASQQAWIDPRVQAERLRNVGMTARGADDGDALGFVTGVATGVPIPLNGGSLMGAAVHHMANTYDPGPACSTSSDCGSSGSSGSGGNF